MSNLAKFLGKEIRRRLDQMDRRPSWLAEKSNINEAGLGRIIKGETSPNIDTVEKIARAFGCSISDLVEPKKSPREIIADYVASGPPIENPRKVIDEYLDDRPTAITAEKAALVLLAYETAPQRIRHAVDGALAAVDIELALSRLRQLQLKSRQEKS